MRIFALNDAALSLYAAPCGATHKIYKIRYVLTSFFSQSFETTPPENAARMGRFIIPLTNVKRQQLQP